MTNGRGDQSTSGVPARRSELDAIRALVVVGLVFFHSALVFDSNDDFYVKNADTTEAIMIAAGFAVVWAMPALFLISGLGAWHSIRRRSPGGFARERLLRLGVPLLFAFVALLPIAPWVRRKAESGPDESYLEFLPRFFEVRLDLSEFPFILQGRYFESGHLWFVVLLLTFSLMLAAAVCWLPVGAKRWIGERVAQLTRRRGGVLLPALAFAALTALAGMDEDYAGWSRWAYLMFFLLGFALAADDRVRTAMRTDAWDAAVLGGVLFMTVSPGMLIADDPFTDMTPLAIATRAAYGAAGWCWVVAILGLLDRRRQRRAGTVATTVAARARECTAGAEPKVPVSAKPTDRRRRTYRYLAAALLPLYILHQPVVVGVAYWVVQWEAPIAVKYLAIVAASLTLTFAAYELLVRRWGFIRFVFGMRPSATYE
ncbi:acyltransferase family protein [Phytoactinopolyspora endophytica]|uniref:acyltransferase family protein n=1 Tax=Phytoactinopolyspora endophytica TaxID=1642495 RepID=UPI00101C3686|nr:acyltransferase family protein [Phytoactinopolyspora endophytica]